MLNFDIPAPQAAILSAKHFLQHPDQSHEAAVLRNVNVALRSAGKPLLSPSTFVEWGCLEHGVVHIHTTTPGYPEWLEVDPAAGTICTL